jgi:hypothetical protein
MINIDIDQLEKLVIEADKIFLTPDGEKVLIKLLEIRQQIEDAIDMAKTKLAETALKIDKNFSSIQSSKVKVYYRSFGERYKIDSTYINDIPKNFYKTIIKYSAIADEVEKTLEEGKTLPIGIIEAERVPQITFGLKKGKNEIQS